MGGQWVVANGEWRLVIGGGCWVAIGAGWWVGAQNFFEPWSKQCKGAQATVPLTGRVAQAAAGSVPYGTGFRPSADTAFPYLFFSWLADSPPSSERRTQHLCDRYYFSRSATFSVFICFCSVFCQARRQHAAANVHAWQLGAVLLAYVGFRHHADSMPGWGLNSSIPHCG